MKTAAQKKWDLLVIPCRGESYLARLVVSAADRVAARDKLRILVKKEIEDQRDVLEAIDSSDRCVTVDGCEKQCMANRVAELQCHTEFTLVLTDIGIEDRQQSHLLDEDLDLAKNAILAASTRISSKHPVFPGCCC